MFVKEIAKQVYSDLFKVRLAESRTEGTSCSHLSEKPKATQGVLFLLLFQVTIWLKSCITSMKTQVQNEF